MRHKPPAERDQRQLARRREYLLDCERYEQARREGLIEREPARVIELPKPKADDAV